MDQHKQKRVNGSTPQKTKLNVSMYNKKSVSMDHQKNKTQKCVNVLEQKNKKTTKKNYNKHINSFKQTNKNN